MSTGIQSTEILFLGTGDAFNTGGRLSQAVLFRPAREPGFLVDAGPTVSAALARSDAGTSSIDRLFITHLHGDHIAGWPFLLLRMAFLEKRTRPLEVVGPEGTEACLEALLDLCYGDVLAGGHARFPVRYRELAIEEASGVDCGAPFAVDVIPQDHHPTSIAYAFHLAGRVIGISGDAAWSPALERLIERCDVVILECTSVSPTGAKHVALDDVRRRAPLLEGRRTFLVHLSDAVAHSLSASPIAGVTAASDGLSVAV